MEYLNVIPNKKMRLGNQRHLYKTFNLKKICTKRSKAQKLTSLISFLQP